MPGLQARVLRKLRARDVLSCEVMAAMQVAERVAQAIPNGISNKLDGLTKHY